MGCLESSRCTACWSRNCAGGWVETGHPGAAFVVDTVNIGGRLLHLLHLALLPHLHYWETRRYPCTHVQQAHTLDAEWEGTGLACVHTHTPTHAPHCLAYQVCHQVGGHRPAHGHAAAVAA